MDREPSKGRCSFLLEQQTLLSFFPLRSSGHSYNLRDIKKPNIQLWLFIIILFLCSDFSSNLQVLLCQQVGITFVLSRALEAWSSTAVLKLLYCGRGEAVPAFQGGFITSAILRQVKPKHLGYHEHSWRKLT